MAGEAADGEEGAGIMVHVARGRCSLRAPACPAPPSLLSLSLLSGSCAYPGCDYLRAGINQRGNPSLAAASNRGGREIPRANHERNRGTDSTTRGLAARRSLISALSRWRSFRWQLGSSGCPWALALAADNCVRVLSLSFFS